MASKDIKIDWVPLDRLTSDMSMTFTPKRWDPPEGQFNEITITRKGDGIPDAVFLDYAMIKGIESMNIDYRPGEPVRMTLNLIIGKVTYVEPEKAE